MKNLFIVAGSLLLACVLSACAPKPTVVAPPSDNVARSALFSNAILFPSDIGAHFYWPRTKSLTDNIRAAGGEIYQAGSYVTIVIPDDALFEPTSSVMLPGAYPLIDDVANIIIRFPDENVIITAHTDNIGSGLYQAKLSHQQAQIFTMTLWQNKNIDLTIFKHFKYAGMGSTRPITEDPSAYGQALNRRIQVTIYPSQSMMDSYLAAETVDQI